MDDVLAFSFQHDLECCQIQLVFGKHFDCFGLQTYIAAKCWKKLPKNQIWWAERDAYIWNRSYRFRNRNIGREIENAIYSIFGAEDEIKLDFS